MMAWRLTCCIWLQVGEQLPFTPVMLLLLLQRILVLASLYSFAQPTGGSGTDASSLPAAKSAADSTSKIKGLL